MGSLSSYNYSNIYKSSESSKFYLFSHIKHFEQQTKLKISQNLDRLLEKTIVEQRRREKKLVREMGYNTPEEFSKVLLDKQQGQNIFTNYLIDDFFVHYPTEKNSKTYDLPKAIVGFNNLLDGIEKVFEDTFFDPDKLINSQGSVNGIEINKAMQELRKLEDDIPNISKSNIQKKMYSLLNTYNLQGPLGEVTTAMASSLMSEVEGIADDIPNIEVTGTRTRKHGQQVKSDVKIGQINLQSKNYRIYDPANAKSFNIHSASIRSLEKYMSMYPSIEEKTIENFTMIYNNINYFVTNGGLDENKNIIKLEKESFNKYDEVLRTVKALAAVWFGSTVMGLNDKASDILGGEEIKSLTNIDFFVASGYLVVPMSRILLAIMKDQNKIKISRVGSVSGLPNAKKMREEKVSIASNETEGMSYPTNLVDYGTEIGKQASLSKINITLKIHINNLSKGV